MSNDEQLSAAAIGDEVQSWVDGARTIRSQLRRIADAAEKAATDVQQRTVLVQRNRRIRFRFVPLRAEDSDLARALARRACLPGIAPDAQRELDKLVTEVSSAIDDLRKVTGFGRLLLFGETRDKANQAARYLAEYRRTFLASGIGAAIAQAVPDDDHRVGAVDVPDLLADWLGLKPQLPDGGQTATLEDSTSFAILPNAATLVHRARIDEVDLRRSALSAGNNVRNSETDRMLADMSVDRLKEASRDQIRVSALTANGITNVLGVLANESGLQTLDGIGETSATRIRAAARTLRQNTFDEMPMRIDIKNRAREQTEFLRRLRTWDATRRAISSPTDLAVVDELAPVASAIDKTVTHAIVIPGEESTISDFREGVQTVARLARAIADAQESATNGDPWDDFLARPADYFALLAELGFITEDDEKAHGDLPAEIVDAVRDLDLKPEHLKASLRGYQSFAARFALVQRKVIIGDEMGLGKTVEAIAVLAHLRAKGEHNSLVICPAAVVTNWVREIAAKSKLPAHRLHGADRSWAAKNWKRSGGVAVTTFETLAWLESAVELPKLGCVVVDEAHYIKNPDALRTQRTAQLISSCERAVLLTGTPLENRLDEFRNLVGYLRPDLVVDANEFAPKKFRRQVAPAYLRRNQEDVLTELPELVEVDEWVSMSDRDIAAYRDALAAGNFMAMRQAGLSQGTKSAKMERLFEIVQEAEANGRRVIVFSHFLGVLNDVVRFLPGRVFGPLTGSVPAAQRQSMVDEFSAAKQGAVLVSQILAGGVGLNIQAASVVVICEPQLKPTTEWQAIARAHRMGQLESVQVHRLLSDEGVDQRLREILAFKKELFESFARESETAASAPEAYDLTETELAREIIASERERLFGNGRPATPTHAPTESSRSGETVTVTKGTKPTIPVDRDAGESPKRSTTAEPSSPTAAEPVSHRPRSHSAHPAKEDRLAGRARRIVSVDHQPAVPTVPQGLASGAEQLTSYTAFSERVPAISQTSDDRIVATVVRIVDAEGPLTGWRIHQVYRQCSAGQESSDEFSRLLNRAISAAERRRLIVSENPYNQSGNKPRTFRRPSQISSVARQLGPRTISSVPPAEVMQYCRTVSGGNAALSDAELVKRVCTLLGVSAGLDVRDAVVAASRLLARNSRGKRETKADRGLGSASSRAGNGPCPQCFTTHAGECL